MANRFAICTHKGVLIDKRTLRVLGVCRGSPGELRERFGLRLRSGQVLRIFSRSGVFVGEISGSSALSS